MTIYTIKYKPEVGRIKTESHPTLQKFRLSLIYMRKCSDLDMKETWFGCLKCGIWIRLSDYKVFPELKKLKNPLKREARYYCHDCLKQGVINDAKRRKEKENAE